PDQLRDLSTSNRELIGIAEASILRPGCLDERLAATCVALVPAGEIADDRKIHIQVRAGGSSCCNARPPNDRGKRAGHRTRTRFDPGGCVNYARRNNALGVEVSASA